ncbi:MAG: rhodanese-like domain-containing protein [Acidobacteriota bacterium]
MQFNRFKDDDLSQYSYAVGCPGAGSVAIVDPRRDIDVYLDFAHREGLSIEHVFETHIHADFASGARELAARTGATLHVSAYDAGETFEVGHPHQDLQHGDRVTLGAVRIEAVHTPGHTPEHLSFLVYDEARSADVPMLFLTGDFLFVGSLGRPDLLGDDAKRALARQLYTSVHNVLGVLPDGLEIHPGHGAGSMCGAGMSGRPTSTLGYERRTNPYLDPALSEGEFVDRILGSVPPFPPYYRRMKRLNSEGPNLLYDAETLDLAPGRLAVDADRARALAEDGEHVVIDVREMLAFGGGHIPGAFGIGAGKNLSTWASWVVPYDRPILLVLDHPNQLGDSVRRLVRVGLDQIVGHLDGGMRSWRERGLPLAHVLQVEPPELAHRLDGGGEITVLDVRTADEYASGHIDGARLEMAGFLPERVETLRHEISGDRPIAIVCGSGYRSTVAAGVLRRAGFDEVWNMPGGMNAWRSHDLPVVTG